MTLYTKEKFLQITIISHWQEVDLDQWDNLMEGEREILLLKNGKTAFVKKVDETIEEE